VWNGRLKNLGKLPEPNYSNLKAAILGLGSDPSPKGSKNKWKRRFTHPCGDYRIIYDIQESVLLADVIDLGHRKDIY